MPLDSAKFPCNILQMRCLPTESLALTSTPISNIVYNFPSLSLCRLAFLALATMATFRTHTLATARCRVILSVHCSMRWTFWRVVWKALEARGAWVWHALVKAFLPASCNSALSCAIFLACFLCLLFQELGTTRFLEPRMSNKMMKKKRAKKHVEISIRSKKLFWLVAAEVWLKVIFGISIWLFSWEFLTSLLWFSIICWKYFHIVEEALKIERISIIF